jgi:hypothetical protein
MRKKRSMGSQSFPTIRQFFSDVIKMLDGDKVLVTEDRSHVCNTPRCHTPRGELTETVAYHFTVAHQPLGARRKIRHEVTVDVKSAMVRVDNEFLRLDMIDPRLFVRLENACADRCQAQDDELPDSKQKRQEGKRTLRRLTREFDRNMKPFQRLAMRLGHRSGK